MIKLQFSHPEIGINENTFLTKQGNTTDTVLNVADTAGFKVGQLILVGNYGSEKTEIAQISSTTPTNTTITLVAGLKFSHSTNNRITVMDYDQIEINRGLSKLGTYSVIATVDLTVDENSTTYKDSSGDLDSWYKIRYYNSITLTYSPFSSPLSSGGYTENSVIVILNKCKKLFSKYSDKLIDRETFVGWMNEGYRIMINRIKDLGFDWGVKKGIIIPLISGQNEYQLPTDFLKQRRFWIRYNSTAKYTTLERADFSLIDPVQPYNKTNPHYFFRGSKIVVNPEPDTSSGDILPFYYYLPDTLSYDSDVLDTNYILASNAFMLTNYVLQKALEMDNRFEQASYFGQMFENQMDLMVKQITDRYPEMPDQMGRQYEDIYTGYNYD